MKNNKGITLVSLIITIIILILLAFISINFLINQGIIEKSDNSTKKYQIEKAKEELTVALSSMIIDDLNIMSKDNYTIEQGFEKELSTDITTFLPYCNENDYFLTYKNYLWRVNRTSKEIEYISDAPIEYTGNGTILDGLSIIEQINKAKEPVKIITQDVNGGYNIIYTSGLDYSDNNQIDITQKNIKTYVKLYSGNNIMIYDGTSSPYFPIMAMYNCENSTLSKKRGLNSISITATNCSVSTPNSNNDWYFGQDASYNYNVAAYNKRMCSNNFSSSSRFEDKHHGHYYSSARLTYISTPSSTYTDLGEVQGSFYAQDNVQFNYSNFIGHNYIIDMRSYYKTVQQAQALLSEVNPTSAITKEINNLAVDIVESYTLFNEISNKPEQDDKGNIIYTVSERAEDLKKSIEYYTDSINDKVNKLKTAIEIQQAQVSDEVLAIINSAHDIKYSISTIEYLGSSQLVNCDNVDLSSKNSGEQVWNVSSVKLAAEIYCNDNIMIYDGITAPYIPVMVRFYRSNNYTSTRDRGLRYFNVTAPSSMSFSTNTSNNDWAFVENNNYNYETTSDRKCSSSTSGTSFNDKINGHYFASGRLTYTGSKPKSILTNLGSFQATACDQDGNTYSFSTGSNYLVDISEYYDLMKKGESLCTVENVLKDSNATLKLANLIIEYAQTNFTYPNAETFANEIDTRIQNLNNLIKNIK